MSDDSSDCSDINVQPTSSKGRQQNRQDQKRKRRIVMRIEFDDSDDSTSASDRSSEDEENYVKPKQKNKNNDGGGSGGNELDDDAPSCSGKLRNRQQSKICNEYDSNDSDEFQRNAAIRRLRRGGRRINVLDVGHSDGSTSGSEVKNNFIHIEDIK